MSRRTSLTCFAFLLAGACSEQSPGQSNGNSASAGSTSGGVTAGGDAATSGATTSGGAAGSATIVGGAAGTAAGAAGTAGASGGAASGGNGGSSEPVCELSHESGVETLMLESAGLQRKVRLFVPKSYDGHTRLPLVLNLHGSSDNADNFAKSSGMEGVAEAEGFVVAGLEAIAGMWNVPPEDGKPDDVAYAADTIAEVGKRLCLDTRRVYASGFSGGGRMSSRLGCMIPDKITAIGPVAGVRWPAPCPGRPVPVITIHGLADATNTYAGDGNVRWNESVEDAVLGWASKNACNPTRLVDDPAGPLSTYSYEQCAEGATVKLIRMDGVDHVYPTGQPLSAPEEIWKFFAAFAK